MRLRTTICKLPVFFMLLSMFTGTVASGEDTAAARRLGHIERDREQYVCAGCKYHAPGNVRSTV